MPGAFEIIRKELPRFLEEPHAKDFVDFTSALVPTTPEDIGLELAFGPFGKAARLGGAALAGMGYSPEAEASPLARGLIKSGGALKNWLDEAIDYAVRRRTHDAGEVERIEKIAKELPIVPSVYSPEALAERAVFAKPNELIAMPPERFLRLAEPIEGEYLKQAGPYVEHYKDLIKSGQWVEPQSGLFNKNYLEKQREKPFKGFSDIPYLLAKMGQVIGHEGRHRNMAIADLFGSSEPSIVDVRGSAERLRLYPEWDIDMDFPVRLGDIRYASGGPVHKHPVEKGKYAVPNRYASGGLAKVASMLDPGLNQIYDESIEFGKRFPGASARLGALKCLANRKHKSV